MTVVSYWDDGSGRAVWVKSIAGIYRSSPSRLVQTLVGMRSESWLERKIRRLGKENAKKLECFNVKVETNDKSPLSNFRRSLF